MAALGMDRWSAHLGYMFADRPLRERFAAAADAGFTVVEHPGPYKIPAAELRCLLADHGLRLSQIALPAGDVLLGEKGFACLPERRGEFSESVERGLDYAAEVGCGMVHVMSGILPAGVDRAALWPTYIANLRLATQSAARRGQHILIEPIGIGTIANYYMDDAFAGLSALAEVGGPDIRLLFDTFHATNSGLDAIDFVSGHAPAIAHLHIADFPGRHEPFTGSFPFRRLLSTLDQVDYKGLIGLKYLPAGDTREGLRWIEQLAAETAKADLST